MKEGDALAYLSLEDGVAHLGISLAEVMELTTMGGLTQGTELIHRPPDCEASELLAREILALQRANSKLLNKTRATITGKTTRLVFLWMLSMITIYILCISLFLYRPNAALGG